MYGSTHDESTGEFVRVLHLCGIHVFFRNVELCVKGLQYRISRVCLFQ